MAAVTGVTVSAEIVPQQPNTDANGVYQIGTAKELLGFAALVNDGETSASAVLNDNIILNTSIFDAKGNLVTDTSGLDKWTPIGSDEENAYTGTFDGQNHTVGGLYFDDDTADYVGLFGFVGAEGKVSNVGVVSSYLNAAAMSAVFADKTAAAALHTAITQVRWKVQTRALMSVILQTIPVRSQLLRKRSKPIRRNMNRLMMM